MKKIIFFFLLSTAALLKSQISEIYNFGNNGPSSNDFKGETRERMFEGKFFYYTQNNTTKKTFLAYKDISEDAPVSVKDITATSPQTTYMTSIMSYKSNEKYLYFTTYTYISNVKGINELWRSDGTESGTVKLSTFEGPSYQFFNISSLEYSVKSNKKAINSINGNFMFGSSPTPNTRAMWITDGTVAGTVKLMENLVTNTATTAYAPINKVGNRMLFSAINGSSWEVWSTDGTVAGTQKISSLFATVGLLNGIFYFYSIFDGVYSSIASTSDGLTVSEKQISIPFSGIEGFIHDDKELYGGSALGTTLLHTTNFSDVSKIADLPQTNTYYLAATDDGLLFAKLLNPNVSDEYTFYVGNKNNGVNALNTGIPLVSALKTFTYKNTFYMSNARKGDPGNIGSELWRADAFNTDLLKDIYPGFATYAGYIFPNNSDPKGFFTHNNEMYFLAHQANGQKLMKFDPNYTFNNFANDNNWSNRNNWTAGATPMSTDNAIIPTNYNVNITGNAYSKNLNTSSPLIIDNGNLNITGMLNLNSNIILNDSKVILKGKTSEVIGANSSKYIVTNGSSKVVIENMDAAKGSINFPVGTTTNYNPVTISNTGVSDEFSVSVSEGISNTTNGAVNSTWNISEATLGGSNVSMSFTWNQSQENANFLRNLSKIGHFKNGVWIEENTGGISSGSSPYTLYAHNVTSFSPFGVMNFGMMGTSTFDKNKATVYPNPFKDVLKISVQSESVIQFYDSSGKLMSTESLIKGSNILDKNKLQKGIYFYKINDRSGNTDSGKLIKL